MPKGADNELELPWLSSPSNKPHWDLFYDYLLRVNSAGELVPGLAESWESSPDGKTWTFKLREDVQFHKGHGTLSAEDVKFTLDNIKANAATNPNQRILGSLMDRVEIVDPMTVRVHHNQPWYGFGDHVANRGIVGTAIVSKKYVESVGAEKAALEAVGTGPFEYAGRIQGVSVSGRAFPQYWATPPGVAEVTIKWIPEDATRLSALRAGEADIAVLPRSLLAAAVRDGFKKVESTFGGIIVWLIVGGQYLPERPQFEPDAPTNNPKVREALNLAVNRQEIIEKIFGGDGTPAAVSMFHASVPGYDEAWKPRAYDPARAKQLLAEAGYPNGFDLNVYTRVLSGVPEMVEMGQAAANYWRAIGVRVTVLSGEGTVTSNIEKDFKGTGNVYEMRIAPGTTYDVMTQFPIFLFPDTSQHMWEDDEIGKLAQQAFNDDRTQRLATMRKIYQREYDEFRTVPIVNLPIIAAASSKVAVWELGDTYGLDLHTVLLGE